MDWLGDMWRWALAGDGIVDLTAQLVVVTFATGMLVLLAGTAAIWTMAGIKAMGQAAGRGWRTARDEKRALERGRVR